MSDPQLLWSHEDGSSGMWTWKGTWAPSDGMQESLIGEICKELGHPSFQFPPFQQKTCCFGPRRLPLSQPSWSSRVPLRSWENQYSQKLFFVCFLISLISILASSVKYCLLLTLKYSSTKVDNGVRAPASSFCNIFQMSGVAWEIKCMATSDLPSADSGSG